MSMLQVNPRRVSSPAGRRRNLARAGWLAMLIFALVLAGCADDESNRQFANDPHTPSPSPTLSVTAPISEEPAPPCAPWVAGGLDDRRSAGPPVLDDALSGRAAPAAPLHRRSGALAIAPCRRNEVAVGDEAPRLSDRSLLHRCERVDTYRMCSISGSIRHRRPPPARREQGAVFRSNGRRRDGRCWPMPPACWSRPVHAG